MARIDIPTMIGVLLDDACDTIDFIEGVREDAHKLDNLLPEMEMLLENLLCMKEDLGCDHSREQLFDEFDLANQLLDKLRGF